MLSVVNTTPRPLYPREGPGARCIGDWVGRRVRKNLASNGIRSSDRPARSQSLYRLRYSNEPWGSIQWNPKVHFGSEMKVNSVTPLV